MTNDEEKINEVLTRGVQDILPEKKALASLMAKRKITLYQGFDPSMPSLHLGNLVGLMKLRQFQKLGHRIIFLVGDFTGMIGDPDKLSTRKMLTHEEILKNSRNWREQAESIIDFDGNNPAKLLFNSSWNFKLTFKDLIEITSKFTLQQMIERDMFQKRIKENKPVHLHEFLYPIAQAYDSVHMGVDLEIGGNDQLFNMLAGRTLMKALKDKEKFVLSTKLLTDKSGNKVGKTTGNAIFLDSSPEELYAGIMSFPDSAVFLGFELLTEVNLTGLEQETKKNPMVNKKRLAFEVVEMMWKTKKATLAQDNFVNTFQKRKPKYKKVETKFDSLAAVVGEQVGSNSKAKRLINQGAVDVGGKTQTDPTLKIQVSDKIKIGTRVFIQIK